MQPTKNYYHNNYSKNNNNNRVMQNINNNNNTNHRQQSSRKMQIEDQYINHNNNNNRYQKYQKHSKHSNNNNKNNNNNNNKTPRKQRAQRQININITPQQYTSLHIKHLGNHSIWKKTTFQNRYNDQRLQLINPNYFINKHVLNIGCNQGFIDIEIAMRFFPKQIYAIDIDHKLIKNAKKTLYGIIKRDLKYQQLISEMIEKRENPMQLGEKEYQQQLKQFQYHLSNLYPFRSQKQEEKLQLKQQKQQQKVHNQTASNNDNNKEIICKKIQDLPLFFQDRIKESFSIEHYLPNNVKVFVQQMFKPQNRFPLNIKFQADNIYTIKYQQDKLYYDTILCLKVTKWIHLTFGDEGIRKLFQKIYDLLRLDGILILQAQDWQSYKRKKNMYPIYRQNYERICYGPNDFEQMLTNDPLRDFKFQLVQRIDHNQRRPSNNNNNKIDYPILIFKKKSTMLYY